jgi:hypothetical protein
VAAAGGIGLIRFQIFYREREAASANPGTKCGLLVTEGAANKAATIHQEDLYMD